MPKRLRLRRLAVEEEQEIARLTRSRTAPVRVVERARIVALAQHGQRVPAIAAAVGSRTRWCRAGWDASTSGGWDGLADAPRSGRPATDTPEEVGELVAASLSDPQELGLPFGSWTLDRLAAYRHEVKGIAITRSRLGEL